MSPGFAFPPPPPPPPRATADPNQSQQNARGRGGRGNFRGRGQGQHQSNGQRSGPYHSLHAEGQTAWNQNKNSSTGAKTAFPQNGSHLPSKNFMYNNPQRTPNSNSCGKRSYQDPDSPEQQATFTPPPLPSIGQKRKFEAPSSFHAQTKPKPEKKPKIQPAPAVPMFGALLPSIVPPQPKPAAAEKCAVDAPDVKPRKRKRKRETNQLGLTPAGEDYESSEDDVDEEALFAAFGAVGDGLLQFEYNGQVSKLSSPAEIKAWIRERRRNYPTQARVAERKVRAEKRHKEILDAKRKQELEATRQKVINSQRRNGRPNGSEDSNGHDSKMQKKMEKHLAKAEELRRRLESNRDKQSSPSDLVTIAPVNMAEGGEDMKTPLQKMRIKTKSAGDESLEGPVLKKEDERLHDIATYKLAKDKDQDEILLKKDEPELSEDNNSGLKLEPALENGNCHHTDLHDLLGVKKDEHTDGGETDSSSEPSDESSVVSSSSDSSPDSGPEKFKFSDNISAVTKRSENFREPRRGNDVIPRGVCRQFYFQGRCSRGRVCKFRHRKAPPNKTASKDDYGTSTKRETLYQKLVAKEKEQRDQAMLQAIKLLGDNGLLDNESNEKG